MFGFVYLGRWALALSNLEGVQGGFPAVYPAFAATGGGGRDGQFRWASLEAA
jgi:hypothetical protein